ncbi:MAG TPA: DUF1127 domain-containing protein [Acetobacteraceae bacterium]|nr:DUF1127 domain-containing protein [Acetobacteraceae bacterium]
MTSSVLQPFVQPSAAPFGGFGELRRRYQDWAERRRTVRRIEAELYSMTSRNLADLGLTRSDIPDVARGRFQRS